MRDDVNGFLAFCPITDLSHADAAYEWQYSSLPATSPFQLVPVEMDAAVTDELSRNYNNYITMQHWNGHGEFGTITGENLSDYLLLEYLIPSCERFLREMEPEDLNNYLTKRP